VANLAREAWGPFIAPQGNLAIGVLETWTYLGGGLDMSGQPLRNLAGESDKSDSGP
jgi:hypothetical protein